MQSPTSADYVSLQILIHDLVWDLGCSPQTLLIFLPRLLQRWTEVVHDCQHRVTNEIEWVSAGWFHYYGPRMIFLLFFSMVPFLIIFGPSLEHARLFANKTNKFDHPVFTGRRSLETRGAPSASSAELRQFRFPLHVHKHFENLSCILLALRSLTHLPGT